VWVRFFILSGALLLVNNPGLFLHEQVKKVLVSKYLKITYFFGDNLCDSTYTLL
jgi:hypothetical protein